MDNAALKIEDYSFCYSDGTPALKDVSIEVPEGQSLGIIGHNGSGKTTLLMHLVGILMPDEGITVAGLSLSKETLHDVRRKIGYVFQDSRDQLFMSTVLEDVAFGPLNMGLSREEALDKAEDALKAVGMSSEGQRQPYHLSGGEMRRVAIASVLAMSPEILVMDEPSTGLDPKAKRELSGLIAGLSCTCIITSHDLEFVRVCTDRVVLLNHGSVAADGESNEILANHDLLVANGL